MLRPSPLFRIDPGWVWIAVGLVTIFVATVIPAQRRLEQDRAELRRLQAAELRTYQLLEAHDRFLSDLREGHPSLLRRLAAASLNRMPERDEALILASSIDRNPIAWIDATVPVEPETPVGRRSLLERLVSGRMGLWSTALGVFCLFVGLVVGPGSLSARRRDEGPAWPPAEGPAAALATLDRGETMAGEGDDDLGAEDRRQWAPRLAADSDRAAVVGLAAVNDAPESSVVDAPAPGALDEATASSDTTARPIAEAALDEGAAIDQPDRQAPPPAAVVGEPASPRASSFGSGDDASVETATIDEPAIDDAGSAIVDSAAGGAIEPARAIVLVSSVQGDLGGATTETGSESLGSSLIDGIDASVRTGEREVPADPKPPSPDSPRNAPALALTSASFAAVVESCFGWSEPPATTWQGLAIAPGTDRGVECEPFIADRASEESTAVPLGTPIQPVEVIELIEPGAACDEELDEECPDSTDGEDAEEVEPGDEEEPPMIELHVDREDGDPVEAVESFDPPWSDELDRR